MPQFTASTSYTNLLNQQLPAYGQVQFPASQVASADPNCLDDYEEGTCTPTLGGSTTYTTQVGRYTKVGRFVSLTLQLVINAIGTGSTGVIGGLPFANNGTSRAAVSCGFFTSIATAYTFVAGFIDVSASSITTAAIGAAGVAMTQPAVLFTNSSNVLLSAHYSV